MPDHSLRQCHVNLAVAYNVWQHWEVTADLGFLTRQGAELLVESARFFADLATHDPTDDRYDIRGVMGPDEFHDGYPDRPGQGIDNNAYINVMAAWALARALRGPRPARTRPRRRTVTPARPRRRRARPLGTREPSLARAVPRQRAAGPVRRVRRPRRLDWPRYRARYANLGRLDLHPGSRRRRHQPVPGLQAGRRPDALLPVDRRGAHRPPRPTRLPVRPDDDPHHRRSLPGPDHATVPTLSRIAHAWVLAAHRPRPVVAPLQQVLAADLADTQGGTTREGIHLGAMAGSIDSCNAATPVSRPAATCSCSIRFSPTSWTPSISCSIPPPSHQRARRPHNPQPDRRARTRRPRHRRPPRRPPPTHRRHGHPIRTPSAPSTRPPTRPRPVTQPRLEHRPDSWRVRSSPGSTRAVRAPRRHEPTEIRSTQPRADRRDRWGPTSPSRDQRGRAPEPRRPRTTAPTERANTSSRSRPDGPVSRTEPPVRGSSTPAVTERRPARYQDRAATVSRTPPRR